ncbi:MAG: proteasome activator [Kribbellaceae bacterium]
MTTRALLPMASPATPDGQVGAEGDVPGPAQLVEELPGVTDPVLFFRMFDMLVEIRREIGRPDLDTAARARAAALLSEATTRLHDALSPALVAELARLEPVLGDEPTAVELRLAYSGTLAWLVGLYGPAVVAGFGQADAGGQQEPAAL